MPRGNPDKLKPARSKREASERGRVGGQKSGEKRRERKKLREILELLLQRPAEGEEHEGTNAEAITVAMLKRALSGDTKAYEIIRDTIGEKPVEQCENTISGTMTFRWME